MEDTLRAGVTAVVRPLFGDMWRSHSACDPECVTFQCGWCDVCRHGKRGLYADESQYPQPELGSETSSKNASADA
jgi:hypothetical protein